MVLPAEALRSAVLRFALFCSAAEVSSDSGWASASASGASESSV